jgi:hypothetical protein
MGVAKPVAADTDIAALVDVTLSELDRLSAAVGKAFQQGRQF